MLPHAARRRDSRRRRARARAPRPRAVPARVSLRRSSFRPLGPRPARRPRRRHDSRRTPALALEGAIARQELLEDAFDQHGQLDLVSMHPGVERRVGIELSRQPARQSEPDLPLGKIRFPRPELDAALQFGSSPGPRPRPGEAPRAANARACRGLAPAARRSRGAEAQAAARRATAPGDRPLTSAAATRTAISWMRRACCSSVAARRSSIESLVPERHCAGLARLGHRLEGIRPVG